MLAWRRGGFSVHYEVSVAAEDREGRMKLASHMLRAPMSLEKMSYDAATGTVIVSNDRLWPVRNPRTWGANRPTPAGQPAPNRTFKRCASPRRRLAVAPRSG